MNRCQSTLHYSISLVIVEIFLFIGEMQKIFFTLIFHLAKKSVQFIQKIFAAITLPQKKFKEFHC